MNDSYWQPILTGQSVAGRPLIFLRPEAPQPAAMNTLIMAAFHGDEPESTIVLNAILEKIAASGPLSQKIGCIPVVNPDGLALEQRVNARGVDINRNFPTQDWCEQGQETPYYSGAHAASEPETQFILSVLEQYPPQKIVSLHTPYRVINYDGPAETLAQAMAAINGYPVTADIGYSTPGSFGTYVGKERGIATITLELPEKEAFTQKELHNNIEAIFAAIAF